VFIISSITLNSFDNEYLLDGLGTSEESTSFDIGEGVCELTEGDFIELKEDDGSKEDKEDDGSKEDKEDDGSKEDKEDDGSKEGLNIVKVELFMLSFLFCL